MKIKGIEFSEETIVNALEKAGISLEKPEKKPKFRKRQHCCLAIDSQGCSAELTFYRSDHICREGSASIREIIGSLQEVLKFIESYK